MHQACSLLSIHTQMNGDPSQAEKFMRACGYFGSAWAWLGEGPKASKNKTLSTPEIIYNINKRPEGDWCSSEPNSCARFSSIVCYDHATVSYFLRLNLDDCHYNLRVYTLFWFFFGLLFLFR